MFTIEKREGRLVEARLAAPLTLAEIEDIVQRVRLHILSIPGKAVCCCDLRQLDYLPNDGVDALVQMFTRDNPRVERSASCSQAPRGRSGCSSSA